MDKRNLFLHEEIMLLALNDKKGTIHSSLNYQMITAGAIMAELLLNGRIELEKSGKKNYIRLKSMKATGDPVMDDCLEKVKKAKRRAQVSTWITRFSGVKRMKTRIAQELCKKGILASDEDKVLLIFKRKIYPEVNHLPEKQLIDRLRNAIFTDEDILDPKTVLLVSIASKTNLLKVIFDRKELKLRKKRIEKIVSGDVIGKATKEAIEAIQAAIMVAVVIPTFVGGAVS
ncbi:GPP34 family phosphoprotein [Bacteroidota bacterium]